MFILRRITSENLQRNTILGESYLIIDKESNNEEYQKSLKSMKWTDDNDYYGFISYAQGSELLPLYKKSTYFIMVGNGQTFANITFK